MATLNLKSINQLVQDQAAAIQAEAKVLINFATGSLMRAFVEANAMVGVWLQGMILEVLSVTRLATSFNDDADSFVNDFDFWRLSGSLSIGNVTFARFTPTNAALIPLGAQVQTADGTQSFRVVMDATNTYWSSASKGYVMPAGIPSIPVPVQAITPGASGNVGVGLANVLLTSISGVDYVSNPAAFVGGSSAELDPDMKVRFVQYIASLSEGTIPAIQYAVASLQLGLQCTVLENVAPDGTALPGYLCITVDDGTGYPSAVTLANAAAAVASVRAGGVLWGVFAPVVLTANIAVVITTASGFTHGTVAGQVADAITTFVNTLPDGVSLPYSQIGPLAWAIPGVTNVSVTLNNSTADLVATSRNVIKVGTLTVS